MATLPFCDNRGVGESVWEPRGQAEQELFPQCPGQLTLHKLVHQFIDMGKEERAPCLLTQTLQPGPHSVLSTCSRRPVILPASKPALSPTVGRSGCMGWGQNRLPPGSVRVACSQRTLRINLGFEPALDIETKQSCPSTNSKAPIKRNTRVLAMHKQSLAQGLAPMEQYRCLRNLALSTSSAVCRSEGRKGNRHLQIPLRGSPYGDISLEGRGIHLLTN